MGGLTKYVGNMGSHVGDGIRTFGDNLKSLISRIEGYGGSLYETAANGGSFIGINYNEIENMRIAVRNYVKGVQDVLDKLNTEANSANALKGDDLTKAVQKYIGAVDKCAAAYVSSLKAFSDQLYEVQHGGEMITKGVEQYSEELKSDVESTASELEGSAEEYTEKY